MYCESSQPDTRDLYEPPLSIRTQNAFPLRPSITPALKRCILIAHPPSSRSLTNRKPASPAPIVPILLPVCRENISVDHCIFKYTHVYLFLRAEPYEDVWLSTPRFSPDGLGARGPLLHERGQIYEQRFACLELQKHESRGAGGPPLSRDMESARA